MDCPRRMSATRRLFTVRSPLAVAAAAAALTCAASSAQAQVRVLEDPVFNPANGHHYVLLASSYLGPARVTADALLGYLPTVNDADENEFLRTTYMTSATPARRLWIGYTDEVNEGDFLWMNGEPVTYINWHQTPPQPSNNVDTDLVNGEDYVEMFDPATGGWNDNVDSAAIAGAGNRSFFGVVEFSPQDNPVGIGRFTPAVGAAPGQTVKLTVYVIPAQDGLGGAHTVTTDGFAIGAPGLVTLLDDGNAPDDTAGDNIYSANLTVGNDVSAGDHLVAYLVEDAMERVHASGVAVLNVFAGDSCDAPTDVFVDSPIAGSANGATAEGASSCQSNANRDVWFRFTPPYDGIFTIETCGSSYDTVLSVHTACPSQGGGEQLGCNDDDNGCGTFNNARITDLSLARNTAYFIRLAAWGGVSSTADLQYALSITGIAATGACCIQGSCQILTEDDCLGQSGEFQGPFLSCTNPSATPTVVGPNFPGAPIGPDPGNNDPSDVAQVSNFDGTVALVTVTVDLTHSFVGDLAITLTSPQSTVVQLWNRHCSGTDNMNCTFSDAGIVRSCTAPVSGTILPTQALSAFNGEDPNGVWTLTVTDLAAGDFGTLNSWTLTVNSLEDVECESNVPCPGDYNGDDLVDLADLINFNTDWQPNIGLSVPAGTNGDYNADGLVDLADLIGFNTEWQPNIGVPCP